MVTQVPQAAIDDAYKRVAGRLSEHHQGQASGRQIVADALEAAAPAIEAAERSRLFVAIRHGISLETSPWRGEALDLIYALFQDQP